MFSVEANPEAQSRIMQDVLATLKTTIAVLVQVSKQLNDPKDEIGHSLLNIDEKEAESDSNFSKNNQEIKVGLKTGALLISDDFMKGVEQFLQLSVQLIHDSNFMIECRGTAALVVPTLFCFIDMDNLNDILLSISSHLLDCYDSTNVEVNVVTSLTHHLREAISSVFRVDSPHIIRLLFMHAVLSKVPSNTLHFLLTNNSTLFTSNMIESLIWLSSTATEKTALVLSFKTISMWVQIAKVRLSTPKSIDDLHCQKETSYIERAISEKVIPHLMTYIDHPIDTVRHKVKAALTDSFQVVNLSGTSDRTFSLVSMAREYATGEINSRGRLSMLSVLLDFISVDLLLEARPDLPSTILALLGDLDLASHACNLYQQLASNHFKGKRKKVTTNQESATNINEDSDTLSQWISTWAEPVYTILSCASLEFFKSNIVVYVIPALIKICPSILNHILWDLQGATHNKGVLTRAAIVFLKTQRSKSTNTLHGFNNMEDGEKMWKGLIPVESVRQCLSHVDHQVIMFTRIKTVMYLLKIIENHKVFSRGVLIYT